MSTWAYELIGFIGWDFKFVYLSDEGSGAAGGIVFCPTNPASQRYPTCYHASIALRLVPQKDENEQKKRGRDIPAPQSPIASELLSQLAFFSVQFAGDRDEIVAQLFDGRGRIFAGFDAGVDDVHHRFAVGAVT